ncbi:CHAP domain-containing protein [Timonella senegalensis]|uniref:CHAP domain-containing protein n=1 Tax=Timonella senegalensis TaxID=1465825 RepID=UPI0002E7D33E|nr:CHAP domain-containing protein [Timonella senegalensis]
MTATANAVIKAAAAELGNFYPGASKYGLWYENKTGLKGYAHAQFCAMGVSWRAAQAGALDIIPLHAYTPSGANWFKDRGRWHVGVAGVKRGDIVYFDFPGQPNRISHVGIVESVNSDGSANTLEFNTSGTVFGDQRNGRVVARKRRKSWIVGYGRPAYAKTSSTSKPSTSKTEIQKMADKLPVIKPGDTGAYVGRMQGLLLADGQYIGKAGIDKSNGPTTQKAVKAFQKKHKLVVDGYFGPKSWAKALGA